jgi:hypothetical protein
MYHRYQQARRDGPEPTTAPGFLVWVQSPGGQHQPRPIKAGAFLFPGWQTLYLVHLIKEIATPEGKSFDKAKNCAVAGYLGVVYHLCYVNIRTEKHEP